MDRFVMHGGTTDKTITGDVLFNDNERGTTITSVTNGKYGTAVLNEDGTISYTVSDDFVPYQVKVEGKWVWRYERIDPEGNERIVDPNEPFKDNFTYTAEGPDGPYTKTVEVVLNGTKGDGNYSPVTTDPADPAFVYGETHQAYTQLGGTAYHYTQGGDPDSALHINTSAGDDRFMAKDLNNVKLNLGAGEDRVEFSGNNDTWGGLRFSTIDGTGDDIGDHYIFTSTEKNSGIMHGSIINAGDGNDEIRGNSLWGGVSGSAINAGGGDDLIKISLTAEIPNFGFMIGNGQEALAGSDLNLGTGKDTVIVSDGYIGMSGGSIDGTADSIGDSYAISALRNGMSGGATLKAGDGDDTITLEGGYIGLGNNASSNGQTPVDATVDAGDGDNVITVTGGGSGGGGGMAQAKIYAGSGDDTITVISRNDGGLAMNAADIYSGGGNDTVTVDGDLWVSNIITGSGRDSVSIDGQVWATARSNDKTGISRVDLGEDNDSLLLTETTLRMGSANLFEVDGGTGGEILRHAESDGGQALVGDVLGLSGNAAHAFITSGKAPLGNALSVKGFESLLLDLADGDRDAMSLDKLLSGVGALKKAGNELGSLIVKGDAGENGDLITGLGGKAELQHNNVTIDGMQGVFDLYTVADENSTLQLYVQTALTTGM